MKRFIASGAVVLALFVVARALVGQDSALARARTLLAKVPLIDGHNDLPWTLRESFAADLSRVDLRQRGATVDTDPRVFARGRVSGQFWSVYIPSGLSNAPDDRRLPGRLPPRDPRRRC